MSDSNTSSRLSTSQSVGERTHLLLYVSRESADDDWHLPDDEHDHYESDKASVFETVLNMIKTCMGTGVLALPFACQQGGGLLFVGGLVGIGAWNVYSIQRLLLCLDLIPSIEYENELRETILNQQGLQLLDDDELEEQYPEDRLLYTANSPNKRKPISRVSKLHPQQSSRSGSATQKQHQHRNHHLSPPPLNTSTLGRVAWYAFGRSGLQCLDISMLFLLFGIIVAYVAGSISFLADTPLSLGIRFFDGILAASVMATISLVPHLGHLSWVSATGLLILFATFVVLTVNGVLQRHFEGVMVGEDAATTRIHHYSSRHASGHSHSLQPQHPTQQHDSSVEPSDTLFLSAIPLLATSISGVSHWFGIVVFSFGVAPLTYSFQSSMRQPQLMLQATSMAVSVTTIVYIVLGMGLLLLYPHLTGDILHELPYKGVVPTATRLAMVGVCVLTAPLLIVPCSQLIESKYHLPHNHQGWIRFSLCWASVVVAVMLPGFVQVLALVGCLCVGWVGFCLPPLFHLRLSALSTVGEGGEYVSHQTTAWVVDTVLLTWGVAATVLSTAYTFQRVRHD